MIGHTCPKVVVSFVSWANFGLSVMKLSGLSHSFVSASLLFPVCNSLALKFEENSLEAYHKAKLLSFTYQRVELKIKLIPK